MDPRYADYDAILESSI